MNTIRCAKCAKKLAEGQYLCLSIKCSRCGTLNSFTAHQGVSPDRVPIPERPERQNPREKKGNDDERFNSTAK